MWRMSEGVAKHSFLGCNYQSTCMPIAQRDLMAQRLARRAEDRKVPGSSPTQD